MINEKRIDSGDDRNEYTEKNGFHSLSWNSLIGVVAVVLVGVLGDAFLTEKRSVVYMRVRGQECAGVGFYRMLNIAVWLRISLETISLAC